MSRSVVRTNCTRPRVEQSSRALLTACATSAALQPHEPTARPATTASPTSRATLRPLMLASRLKGTTTGGTARYNRGAARGSTLRSADAAKVPIHACRLAGCRDPGGRAARPRGAPDRPPDPLAGRRAQPLRAGGAAGGPRFHPRGRSPRRPAPRGGDPSPARRAGEADRTPPQRGDLEHRTLSDTRPRLPARPGLRARFGAFVAEQDPHALPLALDAWGEAVVAAPDEREAVAIDALRAPLRESLRRRLVRPAVPGLAETTPGVEAGQRLARAAAELLEVCDGFLRREAIAASLTPAERRELLRGMVLTRAVDNRLKAFFMGSEVQYRGVGFQGKGFRSLGQEAIYAAPLRLRRGFAHRAPDGSWRGDVIAPLIRDLGAALAMRPEAETVRMVLSAQMGKSGPPMDGRDLHIGAFGWGILPATAPLGISTLTIAGIAMAFAREDSGRVAVSFIGEGGSSLGEWHEAINLCATHRLPAVFCVQNNQTALSTPVAHQSAARVFADKAAGYGVPGLTLDGTDPEAIAAAFGWAAERARAGLGPTLIELVAMRLCGHAHHDDMLYLGRDPQTSWEIPPLTDQGYANKELYTYWAARDPIALYAARLQQDGLVHAGDVDRFKREADAMVEAEARAVIEAPWPEPSQAGVGVFANEPPRRHVEVLDPAIRLTAARGD